jgi:eukaryotic-like serine/threonine-protein kinase
MPVIDAKKRFGPFDLDARTGELRSNGTRVKLQGQPIKVLEILLETPGELVTREQIRERLWSSDTFVDFDHNLNTAIKKLRHALGDEAETPRYIETIPRYGYRFIGQVEKDAAPAIAAPASEAAAPPPHPTGAAPADPQPPPASRNASPLLRALPWALGAFALVFAGITVWLLLKPAPQPIVMRFFVPPPENTELIYGGEASLSPDGRTLAFVTQAAENKPTVLWLRPLGSLTARPVPGTDGAAVPFWSPDSRQIGFWANGKLKKVSVLGGIPQTLGDSNYPGGSWNRDGIILFLNHDSIYRVPDTGGTPVLVLAPDTSSKPAFLRYPQFLPDGRHFIFMVMTSNSGQHLIEAGSLDSKAVENLAQASSNALYAPPGYLFYLDQQTLVARPFNARALHFTGPAVPVAPNVGVLQGSAYGYFSVSPAGVLAYQTGQGTASTGQMTWFSRTGQKLGTVGQPDVYAAPALSPDGSQVAMELGPHGSSDIWVYDVKRGTGSRLTFNPADDANAVWSLDGKQILFSSNRGGAQYDIYQKAADGLGSAQPVFQSKDQNKELNDISPDGRYAIYDTGADHNGIWALPLFGDRKPFAFVQSSPHDGSAVFSPNGRYVAYNSDETGRREIYVQTFPQPTGRWQISASGGVEPMWRRDGKELFFLTLDEKLMAVNVNTASPGFEVGIPKELFQAQLIPLWFWRNLYVPSPDGQRFLMLAPVGQAKQEPITVVVNWPALLKSRGSR